MESKPGPKTSEFKLTVFLVAVGVVLLFMDQTDAGAAILAAAGIGYPAARGLAK